MFHVMFDFGSDICLVSILLCFKPCATTSNSQKNHRQPVNQKAMTISVEASQRLQWFRRLGSSTSPVSWVHKRKRLVGRAVEMAGVVGNFSQQKQQLGVFLVANFHLGWICFFVFLGLGDVTWSSSSWLEAKAGDWRHIYPEQLVDPQNAQDLGGLFWGGPRWGWCEGRFCEVTHGNFGRWGC